MNKIEIAIPEYNDVKSASDAISKLLRAQDHIENEATIIADKYGVSFDVGEYGSGRTYYPVGYECSRWMRDEIENNGGEVDENGIITSGAWVSSSQMC